MQPASLFAIVLALIGPPATQPGARHAAELKLKPGDQIVAIGDSITQAGGYLKVMDAVFAQQYPDLKVPPIINVGIGGQKAEDLVKRFEKDVIDKKPAIVTISIGINDVWHRLDKPADPKVLAEYKANVEKMVKMAQEAKIRVILLAPTVIGEDPKTEGNLRLVKYVAAGKDIARRNKCDYADLHALFLKAIAQHSKKHPDAGPKPGKAIAPGARPEPQDHDALPRGFLTADGVHLLPLGDTLMAAGILRTLGVPDEKMKATDLDKVFPKK